MLSCIRQHAKLTQKRQMSAHGRPSHDSVCWSTPLRSCPDDVLQRVLDVTGLAVQAVLRIDLQLLVTAGRLNILIHTCSNRAQTQLLHECMHTLSGCVQAQQGGACLVQATFRWQAMLLPLSAMAADFSHSFSDALCRQTCRAHNRTADIQFKLSKV